MPCTCGPEVTIQGYENTVMLGWYPVMDSYREARQLEGLSDRGICVDRCIADEVVSLWQAGIRTTGSCCGHGGKGRPFINLHPDDFYKAQVRGYQPHVFPDDLARRDTVIPKSV